MEFCFFFSGKEFFFLGWNFAIFFSGTIFSSRAVLNIFSRAVLKLLGQKNESFLGKIFFFSGKKQTLVYSAAAAAALADPKNLQV